MGRNEFRGTNNFLKIQVSNLRPIETHVLQKDLMVKSLTHPIFVEELKPSAFVAKLLTSPISLQENSVI